MLKNILLDHDDVLGRYLKADRDFSPGEELINEEPLMIIPVRSQPQPEDYLKDIYEKYQSLDQNQQAIVLDLYCHDPDALVKDIDYHKLFTLAEIIAPNNGLLIVKLFFIWKLNATQYKGSSRALFQWHARINHSCAPNAVFHGGVIRSLRKIICGEPITLSYLDPMFSKCSTRVRRTMLYKSHSFHCNCTCCTSPVDLRRVLLCPQCKKSSLILGLKPVIDDSMKPTQDDHAHDHEHDHQNVQIVGTCAHTGCSRSCTADQLPLSIENEMENLTVSIMMKLDDDDTYYTLIAEHIDAVHTKILMTLGGNHWTAAAMLDLRYRFDPIDNGFHSIHYGEACLNWYKALTWDIIQLSANLGFAIGSELLKSPRKSNQVAGRKYLKDCFEDFKNIWGDEDSDVKAINALFETCRQNELRTDMMVCSFIGCTNPVDDRVGSTTKLLLCCGQCHLAYYCDKNCQRNDWKIHKKVCMFISPVYGLKELRESYNSNASSTNDVTVPNVATSVDVVSTFTSTTTTTTTTTYVVDEPNVNIAIAPDT